MPSLVADRERAQQGQTRSSSVCAKTITDAARFIKRYIVRGEVLLGSKEWNRLQSKTLTVKPGQC